MKVPFYDLKLQNEVIKEELWASWNEILNENSFILGDKVEIFEENYALFNNAKHVVGVANGTDAIELLIRALDLDKDSRILIPAHTFIATALAVIRSGHEFELVDVDKSSMLINRDSLKHVDLSQIGCVIPVHMYGQQVDLSDLRVLLNSDIRIIEDGAQSQGSTFKGFFLQSESEGVATSFYPGKNLGAFGDAGAIVTNNEKIALRIQELRNYGSTLKYHHPQIGFNSRLDSIQASVLSQKLLHLSSWNYMRAELAKRYLEALEPVEGITLPSVSNSANHVWHLFVIRVKKRDDLYKWLKFNGIDVGIHYPKPIHLHSAFERKGYAKGDFPVAEEIAETCLSLPLFPGMTFSQQDYVIEKVQQGIREIN